MRIAYLQSMKTSLSGTGGHIHVSQVAEKLLERGHTLYSNIPDESDRFIRLNPKEFFLRGDEIEIFYVRIHGSAWNDHLTLYREANWEAPCIWEVNAPLEELRVKGASNAAIARLFKTRKKLASKLVDGAICVSSEMADYARSALGIKKTIVIPNGSDPDLFSPRKNNDVFDCGKFTILWAGSPEYNWQGLERIVEVARTIDSVDPDIVVAVTAEGESKKNLRYLGRIPYSEMPGYMASADIGLCIYQDIDFYHSFFFSPLKLYDYMASGLPVIGSRAGQIDHVITQCKSGLLTDNSVEDLIKKILYLKRNAEVRDRMSLNARNSIETTYNWKTVAYKTEQFLNEIIDAYQSPKAHFHPIFLRYILWSYRFKSAAIDATVTSPTRRK